ncbi:hypothetical protein BDY21DRAFT_405586, partial [Lineolata rhizophorae]
DYDCFYASVFEAENAALKGRPLAVQQKQIVVTCNYEARRRGLRKLQLIRDAKAACPDVTIVNGEDLTRFRDASKRLYAFLRRFSWNGKVERLGFDEVWMDCTDIVKFNLDAVNPNDPAHSFFCLSRDDPTLGFVYDASRLAGHAYPPEDNADAEAIPAAQDNSRSPRTDRAHRQHSLRLRLLLGSHLAWHLRTQLEERMGYTTSVGVSTSKLLSKLVGATHKPAAQTTLLPPYGPSDGSAPRPDNVAAFLDPLEIGKIPGIGFKSAAKIRAHLLRRASSLASTTTVTAGTDTVHPDDAPNTTVTVLQARTSPHLSPSALETILSSGTASGTPRGIGPRIFRLLHGVDDDPVAPARDLPRQISVEDSFGAGGALDSLQGVQLVLGRLATSLVRRMRSELVDGEQGERGRRWVAVPRTVRLATRASSSAAAGPSAAAPPGQPYAALPRASRSAPLPRLALELGSAADAVAERLVRAVLLPLFRRLHPGAPGKGPAGIGVVNVAVANIVEGGGAGGGGGGGGGEGRGGGIRGFLVGTGGSGGGKESERSGPGTLGLEVGHGTGDVDDDDDDAAGKREPAASADDGPADADAWTAEESDAAAGEPPPAADLRADADMGWAVDEDEDEDGDRDGEAARADGGAERCAACGAVMPGFARAAHARFHQMGG